MNDFFPFSLANRCKTCLMPAHAVRFNQNGCEYCRPEKRRRSVSVGQDLIPNDNDGLTLDKLDALTRSSTGKYNCLVGLSGGRDSTFLLYYVKKIMKLNPLAVNFSTRFQTTQAKRNIADAARRMDVDLLSHKIDDSFFEKLVHGFFLKYGEFCSPCHRAHHYTLASCAREYGAKVIIRGISSKIDLNKMEPDHFDFFCKNETEFNERVEAISKEFGISQEERNKNSDLLRFEANRDKSVLTVDLPDLLEWDYKQIQDTLDSEFDWTYPHNQFFHCDCKVNPTLCYQEYCRHGYSEKQIIISNHLASNDFSIEKGKDLLLSEEMPNVPGNIDEVLRLINVDRDAFNTVVDRFWRPTKRSAS